MPATPRAGRRTINCIRRNAPIATAHSALPHRPNTTAGTQTQNAHQAGLVDGLAQLLPLKSMPAVGNVGRDEMTDRQLGPELAGMSSPVRRTSRRH